MNVSIFKKIAVAITILSAVVLTGCGGGEKDFAPTKEGMIFTTHRLDNNGVKIGERRTTVRSVTRSDGKTEIVLGTRMFDADGVEKHDLLRSTINVFNGVAAEYDIASTLAMMFAKALSESVTIEHADALRIPSDMKPGDVLNDVIINMKAGGGIISMPIVATLRDVKCESVEDVTVPAGKFKAHKVTYTMTVTVGSGRQEFSISTNAAEWYVRGIGVVQSVASPSDGDIEKTVLVSIENQKRPFFADVLSFFRGSDRIIGSWSGNMHGYVITVLITDSDWTIAIPALGHAENGNYTRTGNVGTLSSNRGVNYGTAELVNKNTITINLNRNTDFPGTFTLTRQ